MFSRPVFKQAANLQIRDVKLVVDYNGPLTGPAKGTSLERIAPLPNCIAGAISITIPIVILIYAFQRQIVAASAVKG